MSEQRIAISPRNLLLIFATGLLVVLLWQLSGLFVILMIAVVLAASLAPIIESAEQLRIPRWLAVILVYLGLLAILTGVGLAIGPTVIAQIQGLFQRLPGYLEVLVALVDNLARRLGITEPAISQFFDTQTLTSWAIRSSQQLLVRSYGVTRGFVGGAFSLILALFLSGYMLSGSKQLIKGLVSLFPKPWDERLAAQVKPMSKRMGNYIQGRVLVSGILAVVISVGLKALGISEFALGLGAIAGVTNLIPFFGPVLGAIPALIVAIAQGSWTFLWVLLLFLIIQNVETYVLDPLLVGSSVKIHPLYQLLAVIGGAQVLGIIGALIVPPWVAGASVVLENLYLQPKRLSEQQAAAIASPSAEQA
ncbi:MULTISPECIES: AI-2E family transporter [unclassified Coleofasciculus]|uniref:AI-2E family transporter n=1 Tax=unclassified Coleofasciculus TaxID=2692782 RepID=UPI001882534A|nr:MULTISPECIES: AI-2E family transporter [unclassified Coleofasciculus]MBE9127014.1 AI-2E family transporter [Coleofasciculus sp. LEGE 07081]MBE9149121.1 AI-2E family transporter [Coleofasciculus sp. LEGE 07092]